MPMNPGIKCFKITALVMAVIIALESALFHVNTAALPPCAPVVENAFKSRFANESLSPRQTGAEKIGKVIADGTRPGALPDPADQRDRLAQFIKRYEQAVNELLHDHYYGENVEHVRKKLAELFHLNNISLLIRWSDMSVCRMCKDWVIPLNAIISETADENDRDLACSYMFDLMQGDWRGRFLDGVTRDDTAFRELMTALNTLRLHAPGQASLIFLNDMAQDFWMEKDVRDLIKNQLYLERAQKLRDMGVLAFSSQLLRVPRAAEGERNMDMWLFLGALSNTASEHGVGIRARMRALSALVFLSFKHKEYEDLISFGKKTCVSIARAARLQPKRAITLLSGITVWRIGLAMLIIYLIQPSFIMGLGGFAIMGMLVVLQTLAAFQKDNSASQIHQSAHEYQNARKLLLSIFAAIVLLEASDIFLLFPKEVLLLFVVSQSALLFFYWILSSAANAAYRYAGIVNPNGFKDILKGTGIKPEIFYDRVMSAKGYVDSQGKIQPLLFEAVKDGAFERNLYLVYPQLGPQGFYSGKGVMILKELEREVLEYRVNLAKFMIFETGFLLKTAAYKITAPKSNAPAKKKTLKKGKKIDLRGLKRLNIKRTWRRFLRDIGFTPLTATQAGYLRHKNSSLASARAVKALEALVGTTKNAPEAGERYAAQAALEAYRALGVPGLNMRLRLQLSAWLIAWAFGHMLMLYKDRVLAAAAAIALIAALIPGRHVSFTAAAVVTGFYLLAVLAGAAGSAMDGWIIRRAAYYPYKQSSILAVFIAAAALDCSVEGVLKWLLSGVLIIAVWWLVFIALGLLSVIREDQALRLEIKRIVLFDTRNGSVLARMETKAAWINGLLEGCSTSKKNDIIYLVAKTVEDMPETERNHAATEAIGILFALIKMEAKKAFSSHHVDQKDKLYHAALREIVSLARFAPCAAQETFLKLSATPDCAWYVQAELLSIFGAAA